MSRSPLDVAPQSGARSDYFDSFYELAERIRRGASFSGRERNCAFLNVGGSTFADASAALGLDLEQDGRGMALCDWDHDGDLDLWMTNRTAPRLQLMQNQSAAGGRRAVGFLLEGDVAKRCPRDAAGARLVLSTGGGERVQTVHIGDGFLSQSSRWLHFGLGETGQVAQVTVHWPAGEEEVFSGAEVGGRFLLRQGSGVAVPAPGQMGQMLASLLITPLELPEPSDAARIWLSEPGVLPEDLSIPNLPAGPALVNLWASWCAPCLAELEAFGVADGLPLVLLNVENLGDGKPITAQQAQERLDAVGIRHAAGFATSEIITALNKVVGDKIYGHQNLPLPASFLIDGDRRVRAIYNGSVEVASIREDLLRLTDPDPDPLAAAVPLPGRWAGEFFTSHPIAVADALVEGGYLVDAREYLENSLASVGGEDAPAKLRKADVYAKLGAIDSAEGNHETAIAHFSNALAENPQLIPAEIYLTLALARAGRVDEARQRATRLKRIAPGNPDFLNLGAEVHQIAGEEALAVDGYRAVLALNSRYIPAIQALASIYALSAKPAIRDGAETLRLAQLLASSPGGDSNPSFINTLADAHAANGNFPVAAQLARKAMALMLPYADDEPIRRQEERVDGFTRNESPDARPSR